MKTLTLLLLLYTNTFAICTGVQVVGQVATTTTPVSSTVVVFIAQVEYPDVVARTNTFGYYNVELNSCEVYKVELVTKRYTLPETYIQQQVGGILNFTAFE